MKIISLRSLLVIILFMFIFGCGGKSTGVEGKLVDGKGQPLANVSVTAKMSQPIKGYEQFETKTGADGSFKFGKLLPVSEYQLILYSERWTKALKLRIESGPEKSNMTLAEPIMIRFMDFQEGVVLDTKTNLMWASKDNGEPINWQGAKSYCDNYRVGGHTDWRMPTQDELASLYDENKSSPAEFNSSENLHCATELIHFKSFSKWASETQGSDAATFGFKYGLRMWWPQSHPGCMALPVRSGK
jgi:hypothetical protein